ncbi:MAG: glycosyltransferase family 39 protein [Candidatus Falkowbacteria bacterium]
MNKIIIKFDFNLLLAILIALVFFVGASSYNFITQREGTIKWNSPDETANYYFTKSYATTHELSKFEPADVVASDLVIPRSFKSENGWLKPVSFLGIILIYGEIGSLLSPTVIPYLTPFFGALGIIFFYLLVARLFNRRLALMSAALLAIFPVYLYYSVRSMFHNVLFLVLLIIGFYFLTLSLDKAYSYLSKPKLISWKLPRNILIGWLFMFISGLSIGLAVMTRASELLWLAPILAIVILFYGRRIGFSRLLIFAGGLGLGLLPAFYFNQILYQSPFYGGYSEMNRSLVDISSAGTELVKNTITVQLSSYQEIFNRIFKNIFFFGFHVGQSWEMFRHYVIEMFPWLTYLAGFGFLGLVILNFKRPRKKDIVYFLIWATLSVILVLYYGSWRFTDNPNAASYTIGNSYTRYWLPMYLMAIPLVALAIELGLKALFFLFRKHSSYRALVFGGATVAVFLIAISSLNFLVFGSEEGLINLYYNTRVDKTIGDMVFSLTSQEAVIVTRYHDKVLFPERRIMIGVMDEEKYYPYIVKLLQYYPVYYFNFSYTPEAVTYLNKGRLAKYQLQMDLVKKTGGRFALYKISKTNNQNAK